MVGQVDKKFIACLMKTDPAKSTSKLLCFSPKIFFLEINNIRMEHYGFHIA